MVEFKLAEFKMAAIIKLSQNEWVKDGFRFECSLCQSGVSENVFEWIWEKITRCLNPRWQCLESKMAEVQDSCHHEIESRMSEVSFVKWLNPRWQNSRWLPSSSWVRMNEWSFFVQMVGTNLGKCESVWEDKLRWMNQRWSNSKWQYSRWLPSLVKWEWMSLSQIELVWVRVRLEEECFWVNLREDNKVSESKMTVFESNRAEF